MIDLSFKIQEIEYFLLIMTRVTCFIYIVPFFGMSNVPNRVKIGLGFFISYLIYNMLTPHVYVEYSTILQYSTIVLKEGITGFLIGFGANMCTSIVNFAGKMVDMDIGLSMVSQMDPTTKEESTITGLFYQYVVMLMMIISGMHQYILKALIDTYTLIPINGAIFHTNKLLKVMLTFMTDYIVIGFRICLPVFVVIMLLNAVLGILAKVAPQLNMFAVGIQIKILAGFAILFLTVEMLPSVSNFIYTHMKTMMVAFVEALM